MRAISKLFAAGGLVILTGPLCMLAHGQGYVDVEAERAAAKAAGREPDAAAPADPYGVQPAQAYPATSYGVNNAPAAPTGAAPAAATVAAASGSQMAGSELGNLFLQVQQLQQERDELEIEWGQLRLEQSAYATHGLIEQVAHEKMQMSVPQPADITILTRQ